MPNTFYITTTLPYVNAEPHIGFALEITAADVIARYQRLLKKDVIFNTGTDEHGQKIYEKALKNDQTPQKYCDFYAAKFSNLQKLLNLSYDNFIRTTDDHHVKAAQKFWELANDNGDIYKKHYQVKYCVGCEMEKTDSELTDGRCSLHPKQEVELRDEENYFFRFSKYQQSLLDLYDKNPDFVKPDSKFKEIKSFVSRGLKDFSISRLKEKMPWGIPVPSDQDHVMYVWFDALINYISTIGWPTDKKQFEKYWPVVQLAGKDNLRQQSAMWQAMLLSAGLTNSEKILINGFIGVDGQKMSKSLGNVISPKELVDRYGIDGSRFLLMNLGAFGEDMDVTWDRFDTEYTAFLSNGIGNLCSRVAKMCEKLELKNQHNKFDPKILTHVNTDSELLKINFHTMMENFDLNKSLNYILSLVNIADKDLSENKPWKMESKEAIKYLNNLAIPMVLDIATKLEPFMPDTSKTIISHFSQKNITALKPLFPRLEK